LIQSLNLPLLIIFAAIIGSFLNMLIYRLPKMINGEEISPIYPQKSMCPKCKHSLSARDLLPIFSFLFSFGKCRYCHQKINPRYILVELISVISATILYLQIGFNIELIYFLALSFAFILLFFTDYETHILPDIITIPTLWLGLIYNLQFGNIESSIVGAVIGYVSLWSVFWAFKLIRGKEGMGYGDFKLFALIGGWFGWQVLPSVLLLAAIIGIVFFVIKIKDKNQEFAFGTSLILATPLVVYFNQSIFY
jgi:leader peptidase (prepilin peptidase)/N-methyltransferase